MFESVIGTEVRQSLVSTTNPDLILLESDLQGTSVTHNFQWRKNKFHQNGTALGLKQTVTTLAVTTVSLASGGISVECSANPPYYPSASITAVSTGFVVTLPSTAGFSVGDTVIFTEVGSGSQLSSQRFTITSIVANTSVTLGYAAISGSTLPAPATTGSMTKVVLRKNYPRFSYISGITKSNTARVYFTEKHDFVPGSVVSIRVPSSLSGMTQAHNKRARVLAVTSSGSESSVDTDLNTTGFSTFIWPSSGDAEVEGFTPPHAAPGGAKQVPFSNPSGTATFPYDNRNVCAIVFGGALFDAAATWNWQAYRYENGE